MVSHHFHSHIQRERERERERGTFIYNMHSPRIRVYQSAWYEDNANQGGFPAVQSSVVDFACPQSHRANCVRKCTKPFLIHKIANKVNVREFDCYSMMDAPTHTTPTPYNTRLTSQHTHLIYTPNTNATMRNGRITSFICHFVCSIANDRMLTQKKNTTFFYILVLSVTLINYPTVHGHTHTLCGFCVLFLYICSCQSAL